VTNRQKKIGVSVLPIFSVQFRVQTTSPSNQTGPKKIRKKIAEGFVINPGIHQRVVLPSLSFACLPWSYMSLIFRRPDDMAESVCL